MGRVFWMTVCFGLSGLNGWLLLPGHHGGALNAIAAMVALAGGMYTLASLVKYP